MPEFTQEAEDRLKAAGAVEALRIYREELCALYSPDKTITVGDIASSMKTIERGLTALYSLT